MARVIDLRSDTVTRPSSEMRRAIAEAVVGDDVFGDDPTVIDLEKRMADLLGKETALFVPSGTMANQVALASIAQPGDEVILERQSHIFNYEVAAASALSGLQLTPVDGERGVITAEMIAPYMRSKNIHHPVTRVISIENTHNRAGGRVFPIEEMHRIHTLARENELKVHLDGARLANASVATGIPLSEYAACSDTVSMCFSKGLGAPVGSIVASDGETIVKARRRRKQFGGGMRQVGILAAAALYALDNNIGRLKVDHDNARRLGKIIQEVEGLNLVCPVETNIVVFKVERDLGTVESLLKELKKQNILAVPFGPDVIRMVTHLDVNAEDIELVGKVLHTVSPC